MRRKRANRQQGLGMASGFYLHLGVRGELVSWAITTSSGDVVDRGVMTGWTADQLSSASSAERAATIARGARAVLLDPAEYGVGGQQLYWGWLDWNGRKVRLNAGVSLNGLGAEDWDIVGGGMENAHTFVLKPGTARTWGITGMENATPIRLAPSVRDRRWLGVEPFTMVDRVRRQEYRGLLIPIDGLRMRLTDRAIPLWSKPPGGAEMPLMMLHVTKSMADALLVWLDALEDRGIAGTPDTGYDEKRPVRQVRPAQVIRFPKPTKPPVASWDEQTEKVALGGTAAEHATDFQMARQELMEAVNDAREAMANGQCRVAGTRIDNGYVAYGRLQASAYEGKDISEASRLLRELKAADEPFEQKCVRTEPLSETHERTMRVMRPGLAGTKRRR